MKGLAPMELSVEVRGSGPPVLVLHGFTGCGESMHEVADALAEGTRVILPDLPGHGGSPAPQDPEAYRMASCCDALAELLSRLGVGAAHVVGYSMGARVALALAVRHPRCVRSLVLIGGRAGIQDSARRARRVAADTSLAARILERGVPWFVDYWMAQPLFASQRRLGTATLASLRQQRLANRACGLAGSLRGMGAGAQPPLFGMLPEVAVPALLVTGALDQRFTALAEDLQRRLPEARCCVIPDAGHAAHLERPQAFAAALRAFLARTDTRFSFPRTPGDDMTQTSVASPTPAADWKTVRDYQDIRFECCEGIARITICRPEVRNAFRPRTLSELIDGFARAREDPSIGVILFTGEGSEAFCSGGDQKVRGDAGYVDEAGVARLNALDLQRVIRTLPKPVIALVAGYAIGGGHVLHLVCDLSIAAENARFGQTGPRVGSFDAGFGVGTLARVVGQKKAREIWYLCEQYDAQEALAMGLVKVVPLAELESAGVAWARRILEHSPIAIRCLKAAFNADLDGQAGVQELAGHATQLFYMTEEAQEGRDAFVQKRRPDFGRFPWRP